MNSIEVAIGVVDGKVVAQWHEATNEITFDPKNAYLIGISLAKAALEAHRNGSTLGDTEFILGELNEVKIRISDSKRDMLISQVSVILRSLIASGQSPGYMAMHAVDAVLQETAR